MMKFLSIIQYVYDQYLSKPYTNRRVRFDWQERTPSGFIIERPNHALAHTLRAASYVRTVIQFFQKHSPKPELFHFSEKQIEQMELAMLFAITGRQNDCGPSDHFGDFWQFRRDSADYFEKYFKGSNYFSDEELAYYKERLYDMNNKDEIDPVRIVFFGAHKLDLQRCFTDEQVESSVINFFKKNSTSPTNPDISTMLEYAKSCIRATGDRIYCGKYEDRYIDQFLLCSTNPKHCLETIQSVKAPEFTVDLLTRVERLTVAASSSDPDPTTSLAAAPAPTAKGSSILHALRNLLSGVSSSDKHSSASSSSSSAPSAHDSTTKEKLHF